MSPKSHPETLDLESLAFCEKIHLPLPTNASVRVDLLNQRMQHLRNQNRLYKKNMKEELKEIVNEFRFGESESRSLLDSFKSLLQERRRLKPVKSIKKTVQLKRQRQIKFLVSLLKASEAGFDAWKGEANSDQSSKKVVPRIWNINLQSPMFKNPLFLSPRNGHLGNLLQLKQSPFLKNTMYNSPRDVMNNLNTIINKASIFQKSILRSPGLQMQKDAELDLLKSNFDSSKNNSNTFCVLKMETFRNEKLQKGANKRVEYFRTQVKRGLDPEFNETFEVEFAADEGKAFSEEMLKNKLGQLTIGLHGSDHRTVEPGEKVRGFLGQCRADMMHLAALSGETVFLEIEKPLLCLGENGGGNRRPKGILLAVVDSAQPVHGQVGVRGQKQAADRIGQSTQGRVFRVFSFAGAAGTTPQVDFL